MRGRAEFQAIRVYSALVLLFGPCWILLCRSHWTSTAFLPPQFSYMLRCRVVDPNISPRIWYLLAKCQRTARRLCEIYGQKLKPRGWDNFIQILKLWCLRSHFVIFLNMIVRAWTRKCNFSPGLLYVSLALRRPRSVVKGLSVVVIIDPSLKYETLAWLRVWIAGRRGGESMRKRLGEGCWWWCIRGWRKCEESKRASRLQLVR